MNLKYVVNLIKQIYTRYKNTETEICKCQLVTAGLKRILVLVLHTYLDRTYLPIN